jgi:hypothetical protein
MQIPAFRARTVPELLDATFQMIRASYGQLALLAVVISSPALLLAAFTQGKGVDLLQGLLANYVAAAAVVVVSEAYLGRTVSAGEVLRRVGERFGSIFGASFMRGVMIGLGLLLLVIPGIIATIMTFAMPVVVMVEGRSSSDSFERSRALAKENWLRIGALLLLATVLQYTVAFTAGALLGVTLGSGPASSVLIQGMVALIAPFPAVVATLLYYDLRIRKEGFDIQMLMEAVGGPQTETPAAPWPA